MRSLGFAKYWEKLKKEDPEEPFTTFRLERKDADRGRDWHVGEQVQIVLNSRTPRRRVLGIAEIISKVPRSIDQITEEEATQDGFVDRHEMIGWLVKSHGIISLLAKPMSKFTLKWVKRES